MNLSSLKCLRFYRTFLRGVYQKETYSAQGDLPNKHLYLQIKHHDKKPMKEKLPDMIDTKRRVTKLDAPIILVVVQTSGEG